MWKTSRYRAVEWIRLAGGCRRPGMTIVELFLTETLTIQARGHTALATLAVAIVFLRFRQNREHVDCEREKVLGRTFFVFRATPTCLSHSTRVANSRILFGVSPMSPLLSMSPSTLVQLRLCLTCHHAPCLMIPLSQCLV